MIDWERYQVVVQTSSGRELVIYAEGTRFCLTFNLTIRAWQYLQHGCLGDLAYAMDTQFKERVSVSDVHVVREFLDEFPEDLPCVPPVKQVKFRIDLIPSTTLIAKTSYHLAPTKK